MIDWGNLGLIATRQTRDAWDALATNSIIAHKAMAAYDLNSLFPLYTYPSEQSIEQRLYQQGERQPNLAPAFTAELERRLGLRFIADGEGGLARRTCFTTSMPCSTRQPTGSGTTSSCGRLSPRPAD